MAEGTSLLRMHTAYTCIVSSNLTVSAKNMFHQVSSSTETRFPRYEKRGFFVLGRAEKCFDSPLFWG